jgi:ribosome-associated protein
LGLVQSGPEVTYDGDADPDHVCPPELAAFGARTPEPEGGPLTLATKLATPLPTLDSLERACLCARTAADHKARDIVVLDMRGVTPLYDFFILCTGGSRRQIHTVAEEVDAAMHQAGDHRLGIEGYEASKWVVQDYGDVMVHVFDPSAREYYGLEELYADAPRVDWERY